MNDTNREDAESPTDGEALKVSEAARAASMPVRTAYTHISAGRAKASRTDGQLRVRPADLIAAAAATSAAASKGAEAAARSSTTGDATLAALRSDVERIRLTREHDTLLERLGDEQTNRERARALADVEQDFARRRAALEIEERQQRLERERRAAAMEATKAKRQREWAGFCERLRQRAVMTTTGWYGAHAAHQTTRMVDEILAGFGPDSDREFVAALVDRAAEEAVFVGFPRHRP